MLETDRRPTGVFGSCFFTTTVHADAFHEKPTHSIPQTRGVLHYMGYIGMCGPKGFDFSAVLVINRVSILISSRVWFFSRFGHT